MSNEIVEFVYSPAGRVSFWVDLLVESLFASAFVLIASFVIVDAPGFLLSASAVVMYCVAAIAASRVYLRLKHRHILGNCYVLSRQGISVQENGRQEFIEWERIVEAEYLPAVPIYRLWASGLSKPIVIFAIGGWRPGNSVDRRRNLAGSCLKESLKSKLKTRWLPW
jgi:hypothetical protein